jgi:hypothetical protein
MLKGREVSMYLTLKVILARNACLINWEQVQIVFLFPTGPTQVLPQGRGLTA